MKKLRALSSYLRSIHLIDDDRFESWAESGTLEPSGQQVISGFNPINLAYRTQYDAILSWEAFTSDAYQLFAEVLRWLHENDYDFDEMGFPTFDVEMIDDDSADVEIKISFEEAVYALDAVDGEPLTLVDEPTPTTVDSIAVCGGAATIE